MAVSSSVIAERTDFKLYKGDTFKRTITVTDGAGDPFDFTGGSLELVIKETKGGEAILTLSVGSGISIASNVVTITVTAAQTASLAIKRYVYDLKFTSSGNEISTWMIGGFEIVEDVS